MVKYINKKDTPKCKLCFKSGKRVTFIDTNLQKKMGSVLAPSNTGSGNTKRQEREEEKSLFASADKPTKTRAGITIAYPNGIQLSMTGQIDTKTTSGHINY